MIFDKIIALLKKDALEALRGRRGVLLNAVSAILQLAVFYYLSRAVGPQFRPDGMPYFLFLVIGTGFYSFLFAGMYGLLRSIQEAQQSGMLEVLMTSSTRPALLLSLSAFSAFAGAFVQLAIYAIAGSLFFAQGLHLNFLAGVLVLALSAVIATAIGVFAAAMQIAIHKGSVVLWALGSSAWLLAGTLFPVAALPAPARFLSKLLPFTHSLAAMRLTMLQSLTSSALRSEMAALFVFAALLLPFSAVFLSWTVRRARQLGTLSLQ